MSSNIDPEASLAAAQKHGRTEAGAEQIVGKFGQHVVSTPYSKPGVEGKFAAVINFFKSLWQDTEKSAIRPLTAEERNPMQEELKAKKGYDGYDDTSVVEFLKRPTSQRNGKPILEQLVRTPDGHLYFIEPQNVSSGVSSIIFVPDGNIEQARSVVFFDPYTGNSILDEKKLRLSVKRYCRLYTHTENAKTIEAKNILLKLIKKNGGLMGLNTSDQDLANWYQNPQVRAIILEAYKDDYTVNGERIYNEETSTFYTDDEIIDEALGGHRSLDALDDLKLNDAQIGGIQETLNIELRKYYHAGGRPKINPATQEPWTNKEILDDLPDSAIEATKRQMGILIIETTKEGTTDARVFTADAEAGQLGSSRKGTHLTVPDGVWKNIKNIDLSKPDEYYIPPLKKDADTRSVVSSDTFLTAPEAPSLLGGRSVTSVSTSTTSDSGDLLVRTPEDIRQANELRDLRSEASHSESAASIAERGVALGEDALDRTRARIAALEERVDLLEAPEEITMAERETEVGTLNSELAAAKALLERQNAEHLELRRLLSESEDRASGLQAALDTTGERNDDLERDLKTAQQRVAELEGQLQESREARGELHRNVMQMTTRLDVVQEELGRLREAQASDAEAQAAVRQELAEAYRTSLSTFRARAEEQNTNLDRLREDLADKQTEFEALQAQLAIRERELQLAKAPQPPLISPLELATLRNEIETTREAAEKAEAKAGALQEANQQLSRELEELKSSDRTAQEHQQALLAERQATIDSLTEQMQELEARSEAQAQELEPLRTKLTEAEEEYLGAQTQLQAVRLAQGVTQGTLAAQKEALQRAQVELKEAKETYESSEQKKGELTGELARLQTALSRNMTELEQLRMTQEAEFSKALESLEQEYAEQVEESQAIAEAQTTKLREQEAEIASLTHELDLQAQLATLPPPSSDITELRTQLEETQQALNAANERLAQMQGALEAEAEMRGAIVGAAQNIQEQQREHIIARDAEADMLHHTIAMAQQINAEQRAQHVKLIEELTAEFARREIG